MKPAFLWLYWSLSHETDRTGLQGGGGHIQHGLLVEGMTVWRASQEPAGGPAKWLVGEGACGSPGKGTYYHIW